MATEEPTSDARETQPDAGLNAEAIDDQGADAVAGDVDARRLEESATAFGRPELPDSNWD